MSVLKRFFLLLLLASALTSLFSGCVAPRSDSTIPWDRPADWEGRIPGMGMGN